MKISTLFYTIRQGFANIFRNKWYSLASIATISACLFLFGIFYAIVANFESIVKTAEEGVSVTVFFHYEEIPLNTEPTAALTMWFLPTSGSKRSGR